jgi:hypothetical protein
MTNVDNAVPYWEMLDAIAMSQIESDMRPMYRYKQAAVTPPMRTRRTWEERGVVVYGEPQQPTSELVEQVAALMAEAVRAPIVIPPDVNKLAIEDLVRAGIRYGWQHGRAAAPLPDIDIVWDGDVPTFKA